MLKFLKSLLLVVIIVLPFSETYSHDNVAYINLDYILNNIKLKNPYNIDKPLIQTSQDPRIQAEGKAGQSTDKGIIFVSESNFQSEAGSEWVIGTCVKSPCVAAGNNELVSAYR